MFIIIMILYRGRVNDNLAAGELEAFNSVPLHFDVLVIMTPTAEIVYVADRRCSFVNLEAVSAYRKRAALHPGPRGGFAVTE